MKFALVAALSATLAQASSLKATTTTACDDSWVWEECSNMYWRNDCESNDCGWVYWDDWTWTEFWVTCDEFYSWESCNSDWDYDWDLDWDCDDEWVWEECSYMWYRNDCDSNECGWIYWDDWSWTEFFVTCDEFDTWYWCEM